MQLNEYVKGKQAVIASMGLGTWVSGILQRTLFFPGWIIFRNRNRHLAGRRVSGQASEEGNEIRVSIDKESALKQVLGRFVGGRFLEVGIGASPHHDRLNVLSEKGIEYTACDFQKICDFHMNILRRTGFTGRTRFLGNSSGSYVWTLFELYMRGEMFDVVYLDGHHTFYIDLAAVILLHYLLKPGGYLLVDDVDWSIETLRTNMRNDYREWLFYRKIYDFSQYTKEQQRQKHLRMIVDHLAIRALGYSLDAALSSTNWSALKKSVGSLE